MKVSRRGRRVSSGCLPVCVLIRRKRLRLRSMWIPCNSMTCARLSLTRPSQACTHVIHRCRCVLRRPVRSVSCNRRYTVLIFRNLLARVIFILICPTHRRLSRRCACGNRKRCRVVWQNRCRRRSRWGLLLARVTLVKAPVVGLGIRCGEWASVGDVC